MTTSTDAGKEIVVFTAIVDTSSWSCKNCGKSGMTSLDAGLHRCNIAGVVEVARADERAQIVRVIHKLIQDGYTPIINERGQCDHDKFEWEDCIACYDAEIERLADRIAAGNHITTGQEEGA